MKILLERGDAKKICFLDLSVNYKMKVLQIAMLINVDV